MQKKISIGKMAKLNNISIQTLHHYDKIGLLSPSYIDPETNYRFYSIKQCACLDFIKYLKCMGFTLQEMKEVFTEKDADSIPKLLDEQIQLIDQKMNELVQMKKTLKVASENYKTYIQIPKMGVVERNFLPERKIYCYDGKKDIYEDQLETYEYILRELRNQALIHQFPTSYFCNVGSITRKETIKQRKLTSTEIFMLVDADFFNLKEIEFLPAHEYVSIYCDHFSQEKEYAFKLIDYIEENQLEIAGDYICEVIVELPCWTQYERQMIMKLQIPVKKRIK
ncbi:MerR family transcriptional regulator [Cytobacillus dafuensis]|uniref:MerR family transcriptional regulator n=1 Tax=Cytobacillus dafuensis TaxID=1742359 RepID=A0A5B8Z9D9_CYTDA|nr:helix-turn-helix domain-containing protein [Cytobacillus dafuensis]QED48066.1 MerR family transcriptional regulator [Cytobacillus dafuensis]